MKIWTEGEVNRLKLYYSDIYGHEIEDIAKALGRTYDSVEKKIKRLGLKMNPVEKKSATGEIKTDTLQILGAEIVKQFKPVSLESYKAKESKLGKEEASILNISDVHIGMINKVFDSESGKEIITYNHEILKSNIGKLVSGVFDIHKILSTAYNLRRLYINVLGDIITNDRIFPEQPFEIEKVVGLQVWDAVNYLIAFINEMKKLYQEITVTCVVGNHGRSMPEGFYNEPTENNFEFFIYKVIEKQYEADKRVRVIVPSTRQYIIDIMGHKHLLEHGDAFRGTTDTYIEQQIKNLFVNVGYFDVLDMGHFHKLKERELSDKVLVKQNGGWILKDNWVRKVFKDYSLPGQWFYGCNEKRKNTWSFKLDFKG